MKTIILLTVATALISCGCRQAEQTPAQSSEAASQPTPGPTNSTGPGDSIATNPPTTNSPPAPTP